MALLKQDTAPILAKQGPGEGTDRSWAQTGAGHRHCCLHLEVRVLLDTVVTAAHTVPWGAAAILQEWKGLSCFHT